MTPVSAADVARELRRRNPDIGQKKLHKLLYYCQGHHLVMTGERLFKDEIAAYDMGPVVSGLWGAEKHDLPLPAPVELDEAHLNTVGYVLSRYGALTGTDLEHLTHSERPYLEADAGRRPGTSARIKLETIAAYFGDEDLDDTEPSLAPESAVVDAWLRDAWDRRQEHVQEDSLQSLRARLPAS